MYLGLTEEQEMIVKSVRSFVDNELIPHEDDVEAADQVSKDLQNQIMEIDY